MNIFRPFELLFSAELNRSADEKYNTIQFGGFFHYLSFHKINDISHPLSFSIQDKNSKTNFRFSSISTWQVQFIKRIQRSPFYASYITKNGQIVQITDYFTWQPQLIWYRVFIRNTGKPRRKKSETTRNGYQIQDYHCVTEGLAFDASEHEFHFCEDYDYAFMIMSSQEIKPAKSKSFRPDKVYHQQLFIYSNNEISRFISTSAESVGEQLQALWSRQRSIYGDLSVDQYVLDYCLEIPFEITTNILLASYLDLKPVLKEIHRKISGLKNENRWLFFSRWIEHRLDIIGTDTGNQQTKKNDSYDVFHKLLQGTNDGTADPEAISDDEFPYIAFFSSQLAERQVILKLQSWWDIYSLPILNKKFQTILEKNPESILLYVLLALRYRMSWAMILFKKCKYFDHHPSHALLIYLHTIIIKYEAPDGRLFFAPGSENSGNRIQLKCSELDIRYSSFGRKNYTTVYHRNKCILKLDQAWRVGYQPAEQKYYINHCFPGIRYRPESVLHLKIEDKKVQIPMIINQSELRFMGIRCRWLFKKYRFQLTFYNKSKSLQLGLNDSVLNCASGEKITHYISLPKRDPMFCFQLMDPEGRTRSDINPLRRNRFWLYGFVQDPFGLLAQKVTLVYGQKQMILKPEPDHSFSQMFEVKSSSEQIGIKIKKSPMFLPWHGKLPHPIGSLLYYSGDISDGLIVVLIASSVADRLAEIQDFFSGQFGFEPLYISHDEDLNKIVCTACIRITTGDTEFTITQDSTVHSRPIMNVGIDFLLSLLQRESDFQSRWILDFSA